MNCPTKSKEIKKQLCELNYPHSCGKMCQRMFNRWYKQDENIKMLQDKEEPPKKVRKTNIEWTQATVNVVTGCSPLSDGCKNCYANGMHKRLMAMGIEKYKKPFQVVVCHDIRSNLEKMITKNINMCFINSMSDTFHKKVSDEYIKRLLKELEEYKGRTYFQLLTKRAERVKDFDYPENIWLGVTVEKEKYKERIEYLKQSNAKIKFLSCEPLLGDLGELDLQGIDWVIVGGESGGNARPMHPDWVRKIQRQCEEQNVAFFFKQWGEWQLNENPCYEFPYEFLWKKQPHALLDGKEYKEYPKILYEEEI